jgi:hypothetical protein
MEALQTNLLGQVDRNSDCSRFRAGSSIRVEFSARVQTNSAQFGVRCRQTVHLRREWTGRASTLESEPARQPASGARRNATEHLNDSPETQQGPQSSSDRSPRCVDGARNWNRTSTGYYPTRSLVCGEGSQGVDGGGGYDGGGSNPSVSPGSCMAAGQSDPALARVVAAWPHLPAHVRETILSLLSTARGPLSEAPTSPTTEDA